LKAACLMSVYGTKQTLSSTLNMSTFGGKGEIAYPPLMSANDPKR